MNLIVGLGNPGARYDNTYHNIGFFAVDKICQTLGGKWTKKSSCDSLVCETEVNGRKVVLAKPQTFMNLSGEAVKKLVKKYHVVNEDICIILDDIDLEKGVYRYRKNGSGGSHNGLKNIVFMLGNGDFARIRIGIGKQQNMDLADYVLSKIDAYSNEVINAAIEQVCDFTINKVLERVLWIY